MALLSCFALRLSLRNFTAQCRLCGVVCKVVVISSTIALIHHDCAAKDMDGADFGITVESDSDESTSMPAATTGQDDS